MRAAALALGALGLLGCKGQAGEKTAPPSPGAISSKDAAVETAAAPSPIAPQTRQLIVGISADWQSTELTLRRFDRAAGGAWQPVGEPWPGALGRTGLAWGRGLHGDGPVANQAGPSKREGDGKSPAGIFAIGSAFGYGDTPAPASKVSFTELDDSWRCVDDPESTHYNRVFDAKGIAKDWSSAERMRRSDELYERVLLIDHNSGLGTPPSPGPAPVPGGGSCIFFHLWSAPGGTTVGCTAMALDRFDEMLSWLDPAATPVFVALPRTIYESLAGAWQLPPAI